MTYNDLSIFLNRFIDDIIDEGLNRKIFPKKPRDQPEDKDEFWSFDQLETLSQKVLDQFINSFGLQNKKKSKTLNFEFVIIIDEIDNFSKNNETNKQFKLFLNKFLKNKLICPKIIGIANSVELFKGDLNINNSSSAKANDLEELNIKKIIFDPYTKEDLQKILFCLMKDSYEKHSLRSYFDKILNSIKLDQQ